MNPRLFPTLLIILSVLAAAVWAWHDDWRKTVYWLAAAVLTFVTNF